MPAAYENSEEAQPLGPVARAKVRLVDAQETHAQRAKKATHAKKAADTAFAKFQAADKERTEYKQSAAKEIAKVQDKYGIDLQQVLESKNPDAAAEEAIRAYGGAEAAKKVALSHIKKGDEEDSSAIEAAEKVTGSPFGKVLELVRQRDERIATAQELHQSYKKKHELQTTAEAAQEAARLAKASAQTILDAQLSKRGKEEVLARKTAKFEREHEREHERELESERELAAQTLEGVY